jgi:endoglycosylceramidase
MRSLVVLVCLWLAACGSDEKLKPAELSSLRVTVDGTVLLDELGREVILRGVNAGGRSKFPPFIPFDFTDTTFDQDLAEYLDRVVKWGHNLVRMPFSWEGLEPERLTYDSSYLDRYTAMIDAAAARGLRVIVDFHQDVFARPYCGDGFPLWALPPPVPDPPADCTDWFMGYFDSEEVREAFDRFWNNSDQIRDSFEDMWRYLAGRTWSRQGVIGFEVINEPAPGTADEETWAPQVLTAFYSRMVTVIREVAPDAPVFFDSSGISATTAETTLERPQVQGLVFAPHYYDASVVMGNWSGADPLEMIARWKAKADGWAVPCLLGEFGVPPSEPRADEYLRAAYDALDTLRMHATVWEYSHSVEDWNDEGMSIVDVGTGERSYTPEVVRAYPAAVAGTITSYEYNAGRRSGTLVFDAQADGLTEIAVPTRLFEDIHVQIDGPAAWTHDRTAQRLLIKTEKAEIYAVTFTAR